jgi:hypothetical protein
MAVVPALVVEMDDSHPHLLATIITVSQPIQLSGEVFLTEDVLWDGIRCEGGCCNKSPPWFSITLKAPTTDNVPWEVRMCGKYHYLADTPIKLLEIYVQ